MKAGQIFLETIKEKGIEGGEVVLKKVLEAVEETLAKVVVHPEAEATEKTVALVLTPVFGGFKPTLEGLIDLNKDGKVG